ncbi:hypothetical protein LSCM4_05804 [Leishmania orientalis]|uniref:Plectin n=1 Tax=Leishmania orientalis TaxID=2249476 RepID=A0A836KMG8_9TRYP|nr:hypothetical protein LSCM4_05804 [Leishmania orientalis]
MHTSLSGNSAPPLQRVTAPVGMKSPSHHHYHSTGGGGIPVGHTLPLFSLLTPEREEALRAKGRQLLDEHHREVAEKGLPYAAEEMAALQARGRELLRTAREAAAANGGHHVPAPMLSAAARMAAATAHLSTLHTGAPSVGVDGDRSGAASSASASTQLAHPTAVMSYPDIAKSTATAEGEVPSGPDKLTSVDATAIPSPSLPSKTQELLAAVQHLPRVVAEQQGQLHKQTSSAPVASGDFLSKSQVDALRQTLIQQFNEHMSQCERANQAYWAQVSSQHEKQLSALRLECAAHERRAATAEAAAQTQQLQRDSETEANANTANALRLDISRLEEELQLARQQHIDAEAAKQAVEAEAAALRDTLRVQSARLSELEQRTSYVDSQLPAVQEKADQAVRAIQGQLDDARRRIVELIAELEAANAELLDANAELRAARESDCGAANPFADARESDCGAANPFADAEGDGELDVARRRIAELEAELEAANAELLDANAELRAARESDCGAANPFADAEESDCGAANPFADAEGDGELDVARRRIAELEAELEAANAELLDANAELRAARESDCGAANPFADAEGDGELDVARRRIAELEAANAELLDANAELRAARESDCGAANPFADAEGDGELDAARRRIAELEAANAELLDANAELRAARESDCGAANPFADAEGDGELDVARRRIVELEAANAELRAARESDCGAANPFADAEGDGELDVARRRIAELEAANAELRAARESDCGAANPFADAEGDGELDVARRRIVELEAANAELRAARESDCGAAKAPDGELEALRQYVADLEDALAEAAGDLERLQEDVEERSRLIQALRAGEAALGFLPTDFMGNESSSRWNVAQASEGALNGLEDVSGNSADLVHVLRTRVADLTHELQKMRRQQEHLSVSAMVPGMEALGRQYADVEHRLALAEEANAALEDEVQQLRGQAPGMSCGWMPEEQGRFAEAGGQNSCSPDSTARTVAMATASASLVKCLYASSDGAETSGDRNASNTFAATESAAGVALRRMQPPAVVEGMPTAAEAELGDEVDDDSHNTPYTVASYHMGCGRQVFQGERAGAVTVSRKDGAAGRVFGTDAGKKECRRAASSRMLLPAGDEDPEAPEALSAGRNDDVDFNDSRLGSRDIDVDGDEDDDNTAEWDVSVSTRAAASHGLQTAYTAAIEGKVDDSGAAMQKLGRQYADAQHRLYRSEEARQSLEAEVLELREMVEELRAALARQPRQLSLAARVDGDVGGDAETYTITTSFASSVPTAARERPTKHDSRDQGASSPTAPSSRSADDVESGSLSSAHLSEQGVSVTTTAAPAHDDDPRTCQYPLATAASEDTAALHERIADLEARLREIEAQHEEEIQAIAEAAADRITAMEQQYADDMAATRKAAVTAEEERRGQQEITASLIARVTQLTEALADAQTTHAAELQTLREGREALLRQRLSGEEDSLEAAIQKLEERHQDHLRVFTSFGEPGDDGAASKGGTPGSSLSPQETAQYWKAQHTALLKRFDQLQREYDAFSHDIGALQRRANQRDAIRQEQDQSRTMREATAQQLTTLHRRLEEMSKVVDAAQADAQARSEELRDLTARHSETEAALHAEVSSLRSQVQSARGELARANNLNGELSELLQQGATSVETALQERDVQCAALGQQVQQLKLQLAAAGDRLADQQAALHEQRVSSDALQQRLVELEEEKRAAEAQLREVRRDTEERERAAISAADRGSRDAEQARAAAQQAIAQQHAAHAQEIAALHRELDDLRNELEVAQTVAATVPLEAQRHQRDLGTVRDRLAEALRSQQELQQQLNRSRLEVERQRLLLMSGGCGNGADASDIGEYEGGVRGGAPAADARLNTLLHRSEELEEKLRETTVERDGLQQERDRLSMQVKSAARVAEVKEQATRRQEAELRSARSQLAAFRDDLAQRVQSNHALQLELDHLQERLADTTRAYEELKGRYSVIVSQSGMQEHAVALLMAKAVTIPRALEEYEEAMFSAYQAILQAASKDRRHVYDRCDRIEKAASEAMAEAEAQSHAYEVAIADAQEEQQQMKEIIERLHRALQRAEEEKDAAVAAATASRAELEANQRQAREDVFNAQRDLQGAELQHADTLHSLSLLQDEVANTAALIKNQKKRYEQREAELMEEVALLQAELETRKSSARQLQQTKDESCAELQDVVDEAVQARDRAVHEAQALQAQLARVLPRLAQLEDEQAQRTADLMDTAQQLSALHKKTTSTENVSRKHIEELNQTLQELLQAHAALQRTHTFTEATADRLKSQLADVTEELQRTAAKASQQEEELAAVKARLHEVETHTSSVIADGQTRLQDSERRLHELEQRNTALQQECKTLQECLQSLRIEHDRTVDALQRKSEAMAAQGQQVNAQLQLLRERVATLEAERQELMSSEQALTASRDACQREILSLEHQVEHLQHHLDTSNGHNERLNQEVVQLKSEHAAEVDRLREAMTDAQKELNKCRQLLAKAEARQMEQESTNYSLSTEVSAVQEELTAARAQAEKAMQQCRKAKTEQEEMVTLLQSQIAQLHEELRGKQEQLRVLENTSAHQQYILNALRQDITEAEESLKRTRRELLNQQEAAAAAKEHHRRDRYELQAKLNDAEDAMTEMTRSQEQYRQRMTTKVELYEVAEEALRGEVTDLRADVARLEEALAATTHGKAAAETHQSRQAQFIKAAESELQSLRAQTAHDMTEITNLKLQVQQRTAELDRCRREAAAQLGGERLRWEAEHTAARDALEEALRQEQQASKDAREARERALTLLDCKQKAVCAMEDECRAMREQLRQLRRSLDAAQHQLTSLEGMAKDTADDLGMTLEDLLGGEGSALVDAAPHPHDTSADSNVNDTPAAVSATAVQSVMDELQRRLNIFTFAANTFDSEDDQMTELRKALERHGDVVQLLAEACTGESMGVASSATPLRTGRVTVSEAPPGLNSTPAPRSPKTVASSGVERGGASASTVPPHAVLTAVQLGLMQHIGQANSTYVHRVEDHLRTAQQMLRCVMMAIGSHEIASPPASHPSTAALSSRHRLHVAATVAELHRRTAALTRAAERTLDLVVQCGGGVAAAERSSTHSHMGSIVQEQLQELRRLFSEAERYVLVPFNELLCAPDSTSVGAAVATTAGEDRGAGGQPLHKSRLHTERSQLVKLPGPDIAFTTTATSPERPSPSTTRTFGAASVQEVTVAALSPIKREDGARQWF